MSCRTRPYRNYSAARRLWRRVVVVVVVVVAGGGLKQTGHLLLMVGRKGPKEANTKLGSGTQMFAQEWSDKSNNLH